VSEPSSGVGGLIQATLNDTLSLRCVGDPGESGDADLAWRRNDAPVRLADGNRRGNSSVIQ